MYSYLYKIVSCFRNISSKSEPRNLTQKIQKGSTYPRERETTNSVIAIIQRVKN